MLEGAAATVGAQSVLWGSRARWPRRLVDSPRVGDNRRPFALRRGWRQAVVRSLAAFKAQGGSDGSVIGAIVQGHGPKRREALGAAA